MDARASIIGLLEHRLQIAGNTGKEISVRRITADDLTKCSDGRPVFGRLKNQTCGGCHASALSARSAIAQDRTSCMCAMTRVHIDGTIIDDRLETTPGRARPVENGNHTARWNIHMCSSCRSTAKTGVGYCCNLGGAVIAA